MTDYNTLVKEAIRKAYEEKENTVAKFEVGKEYGTTSCCDHNCWFTFTIIKRTAKTVVIEDKWGKQKRCKIHLGGYFKNETIFPMGQYSMCPVLRADRDMIEAVA